MLAAYKADILKAEMEIVRRWSCMVVVGCSGGEAVE